MREMTQWNPFERVSRLAPVANFGDMLRSLGARPDWLGMDGAPSIPIDVAENEKSFTVKAEIPGVDKDDLQISVEGNSVRIGAEVKREKTTKDDESDICVERYYGSMHRSFTLPNDVDSAKAKASYENGILTLELPKKPNGTMKKITVT